MNRPTRISLLFAGLLLVCGDAAAELAVIVHPDSPLTGISVDDVRDLYLGKIRSYRNGGRAEVIDLGDEAPARALFYATVVRKTGAQLNAYWAQRMFAGKGLPPDKLATDNEVIDWVARNPQGLGYVDKSKVNGNVKVLMTIR